MLADTELGGWSGSGGAGHLTRALRVHAPLSHEEFMQLGS